VEEYLSVITYIASTFVCYKPNGCSAFSIERSGITLISRTKSFLDISGRSRNGLHDFDKLLGY